MSLNVSLWVVCMWSICLILTQDVVLCTYILLSPPGVWFGSFTVAKCIPVQDALISRETGFVHLRWAELCAHHSHACVLSTNVHLIPRQLPKCQRRDRREGVWCPRSLSVESELHSLRLELSVTCRLQLSLLPCCALIYTLMIVWANHAMGSQDACQMQGPLCMCQLSNSYLECQHTSAHLQHQGQIVFSMELTEQTGRK